LIENDADVFMQDNYKVTVLMNVVGRPSYYSQQIPVQLVLAKLNVSNMTYLNLKDGNGWTALHHATARGRCDSVYELLSYKPDLSCKTTDAGYTALHNLFRKSDRRREETREIFLCLLEHENGYRSNEINIQDFRGRTVLHLALNRKYEVDSASLEYLSRFVDVSIADATGATALHTALYHNASQAVILAILASKQGGCGCQSPKC